MEENPNAVFYGKELAERFATQFDQARSKNLITIAETPSGNSYFDYRTNKSYFVVADQDGLEALDEDDPETDPIHLTPDDLRRYALNLPIFAKIFQETNQLSGKPAKLTERLFFIGEGNRNGVLTAFVLAFLNDSDIVRSNLVGLPNLLPNKYLGISVICPNFIFNPNEVHLLESLGMNITALSPDNPFIIPQVDISKRENTRVEFEHSDDFRWVKLRGAEFKLSKRRAKVIAILHDAYRVRKPVLSWEQISSRLGDISHSMSALFKKSPAWKTLIIEVSPGLYRLNLE